MTTYRVYLTHVLPDSEDHLGKLEILRTLLDRGLAGASVLDESLYDSESTDWFVRLPAADAEEATRAGRALIRELGGRPDEVFCPGCCDEYTWGQDFFAVVDGSDEQRSVDAGSHDLAADEARARLEAVIARVRTQIERGW